MIKAERGLRRSSIDFLFEIRGFFGVLTNYRVFGVHAEEVDNGALKKETASCFFALTDICK